MHLPDPPDPPDAPTPPRRRPAHAGPPAHPRTEPGSGGGSGSGRIGPRTIRAKIVVLLMVPVVSLLALWGSATVDTARDVWELRRLKEVDATLRGPVDRTVAALQAERRAAAVQLARPGAARAEELRRRARSTGTALPELRRRAAYRSADAAGLGPEVGDRLSRFVARVSDIAAVRARVLAGGADPESVGAAYTRAVATGLSVTGSLAGVFGGSRDGTAEHSDARVLLDFSRAREMLSRQDARYAAGVAAGSLGADAQRDFTGAAHTRRTLLGSAAEDLNPADRALYRRTAGGRPEDTLTALEDRIAAARPGKDAATAAEPRAWAKAAGAVVSGLRSVEAASRRAADRADPLAGLLSASGAAVLLGFAAVLVSLLISVRIGRGLVVELLALRGEALELAGSRLPDAMRRLRAGEQVDIDAEAPVRTRGNDEVGQVGQALDTLQRAALNAAAERAELLSGVSGVFVNLARRSQVLVHRQLTLLDAMERRTEDPSELQDLFRLDHLTTRMRRHAEGLIILSGAAPGRAWRRPVPLIDVVRASVAEVEEYPRVEVRRLPKVAITGGAVADLTHLVAELVDNATVFSPPNTKVHVHGERVGTGYVLEVEDRGLGMGKAAMTETNQRLESVQELDLFDSDRLGLFVVARLANRHGVKVSLRPSAYGGTTAVVLIPTRLLEALPDPSQAPRTPRRNAPAEAVNGDSPASRAFGPATGGMAGLTGVSTRRLPGTGQPEGEADGAAASAAEAEAGAAAEAEAGFGAVAGPDGSASLPGQRRNLRAALGGALPELPPEAPPDGALVIPTAFAGSGPALQPPPSARPVAPPDPEPASESATVPNPTSTTDPGPELNPDSDPDPLCDLPRRVRQASLVPQLRGEPAEDPEAQAAREGTLPPARSPEQARATMSAFRSGWVRGRQQHDTPHREEHTPVTQPARRNEEAAPDDRDDEPSR